jgi:hypothetical protein
MNRYLKTHNVKTNSIKVAVIIFWIFSAFVARGVTLKAQHDGRLKSRISKSGLNRITNHPYRIVQVTGDESKYRMKHDEDGENVFLMPLGKVGDRIEISLKYNIGTVHDLELEVAAIKGQSINIDSLNVSKTDYRDQLRQDLSEMLSAMSSSQKGKLYVQQVTNIAQQTVS